MLVSTPLPVAVTFTLNVHEAIAASVPPVRLTLPLPATAVIRPPPHEPVTPFGVATTMPPGSMSVRATPFSGTAAFGLLIVKLKAAVPPGMIDAVVPNDFTTVGGATTAGVTFNETAEVMPVIPPEEVTQTLLVTRPAAVAVTLTEKVHEAFPPKVALARDTLPEPATAVIGPPPQVPVRPLGVATIRPPVSVSVKATPLKVPAFGLLMANVKVVVPPTPTRAAPNTLRMDGAKASGGAASTATVAVEVFPAPPSVEVTATLLLYAPVVPVTLTEMVQEAPPVSVPPVRETIPEAATALVAPRQVLVKLFGVATDKPVESVSVKATPLSPTVAFGLLMVKVKVVVPPVTKADALKALTMLGGATKLALQSASETLLLSSVTAPFCAKVLPDTVALVFNVMLVSARMFPMNEVVVPRVAELPTCQNTLQPEALLITFTDELLAVVSDDAIWKTKTAPGFPWASRVSVPVN